MIAFAHRRAFWFGIAAVSVGVVLHLPMYLGARDVGYQLAGMPMDPSMKAGTVLIVVGIALSVYGLVPREAGAYPDRVAGVQVAALDEAPIQRAHLALLAVMAVAVTIDVMKPTTLAFVVPGVAQEYGLKSPLNPQGQVPVALLPLCALVGMVSVPSDGAGWATVSAGGRRSCSPASCSSPRPSAARCPRSAGEWQAYSYARCSRSISWPPGRWQPPGPSPCPALAMRRPVGPLGIPAPRCSAC